MGKNVDWTDIRDRLTAVFFPERCVLCGEVVIYDDMWCGKCKYIRYGEIDCGLPHKFIGALAAAEYSGKTSEALWRIKNKPDKRTLLFFAGLMREAIQSYWPDTGFDLIVPVPISPEKLKTRGFNQAEVLARQLSKLINVPVQTDALVRYDDSQVQHTLKRAERQINAEKSYGLLNTEAVRNKAVLLTDDVFTTGATLAACTGMLLQAGAKGVHAVTATAVRPK